MGCSCPLHMIFTIIIILHGQKALRYPMHISSPTALPLNPVSFDSNSEYPLDTTSLHRPATLGVGFLSSQSLPSSPSSHLVSFCYFPSCICVQRDSASFS